MQFGVNRDFIFNEKGFLRLSKFYSYLNLFEIFRQDNKSDNSIYNEAEWAELRNKTILFNQPTELSYRVSSYQEYNKIAAANALANNYDFANFSVLGDIGGCPFYQARVILDYFPNLSALLTDIDIESCMKLEPIIGLDNIEFIKCDIKMGGFSIFDPCDILTMWGVDYIMSDYELISLFKYVKMNKKVLILATVDCEKNFKYNPKALMAKLLYNLLGNKPFGNRLLRSHGFIRTKSYFFKLAILSGAQIKEIQNEYSYRVFLIY